MSVTTATASFETNFILFYFYLYVFENAAFSEGNLGKYFGKKGYMFDFWICCTL